MTGVPPLLSDEDVPPRAAEVARGLGLDVRSIHEAGRLGWADYEQLRAAASDGRAFVTYNRNDFIHWTREFFRTGAPHAGVLVLSRSIPRDQSERIAHALLGWAERMTPRLAGAALPSYHLDCLSAADS